MVLCGGWWMEERVVKYIGPQREREGGSKMGKRQANNLIPIIGPTHEGGRVPKMLVLGQQNGTFIKVMALLLLLLHNYNVGPHLWRSQISLFLLAFTYIYLYIINDTFYYYRQSNSSQLIRIMYHH